LGLRPHECIFVDDLEVNVKGAEDFGLKGIHVREVQILKYDLFSA
jgi:HAD superfamily hydrolase (TIGR01509 family)